MYRYPRLICFLGCMMAPLTGCQPAPVKVAASDNTPVVPVSRPVQRLVTEYVDYTGRTNAKDSVIIQPRVTGYLTKMAFEEGKDVKADDILFEIDPRPYQAQYEAALAAVAQNEAGLTYAKVTNQRFKEIAKKQKDAVSERELDQYRAQEEQALASLNFARANLISAKLNLEWTVVKSPIDGRISRYYLTKGNLVNQDVTQLTTVVSLNPMYVYFDMDEPTLLRIKRAINEGRISPSRSSPSSLPYLASSTVGLAYAPLTPGGLLATFAALAGTDAPVLMGMQGEEGYPHFGAINFIDNQVSPGTGSISVRGAFPNPIPEGGSTYLLTPGMFVRVRLPIGQPQEELLVIDRAVTSDQGLKYVYVIDADNKVEARRVSTGALQEDGLRVITQGLKKDDWVLVGGLQQVRPRMTVPTERVTMPSLSEPAIPSDKGKELKKAKKK